MMDGLYKRTYCTQPLALLLHTALVPVPLPLGPALPLRVFMLYSPIATPWYMNFRANASPRTQSPVNQHK
jgi:hypothetical protein